jgi:hypothetical protein
MESLPHRPKKVVISWIVFFTINYLFIYLFIFVKLMRNLLAHGPKKVMIGQKTCT